MFAAVHQDIEGFLQPFSEFLEPSRTSICESLPASCARTSRMSIRFTSLTRSDNPAALHSRCSSRNLFTRSHVLFARCFRFLFVQTPQEERRHLIGWQHLAQQHRIVIHPDKPSCRTCALRRAVGARSRAHPNSIRQHAGNHRHAYPRQPLKPSGYIIEIRLPNSGSANFASDQSLNICCRGSRIALYFHFAQSERSWPQRRRDNPQRCRPPMAIAMITFRTNGT